MTTHETVETMPIEQLRARVFEAQRIVAQAKRVARGSFADAGGQESAVRHVSALLDAAQKLLPGAPILEETPVRAAALERAQLLAAVLAEVSELFAEISASEARTPFPPGPPSPSTPARAP